jgi:hypothetical protein
MCIGWAGGFKLLSAPANDPLRHRPPARCPDCPCHQSPAGGQGAWVDDVDMARKVPAK